MSEIIKTRKPVGGLRIMHSTPVQHALGAFGTEAATTLPPRAANPAVTPLSAAAKPAVRAPEELERLLEEEYRKGVAEGRASGEEAARKECEQRLQEDQHRFDRIEALVREQLAQVRERIEREAYHFALAVAGRIVKKEVGIDSEIIVRQVQEALRRVAGVESVKLRLNPQDETFVRERRSDLLSAADSVRDLVIEGDDKIERGGCILETASGTVDARTSTQLEQIEAALFGQTLS